MGLEGRLYQPFPFPESSVPVLAAFTRNSEGLETSLLQTHQVFAAFIAKH